MPRATTLANNDLVEACGLYTTGPQSTVEGRVILVNGTTQDEHSKLLCWWKNSAKLGSRIERDPDLYVMLHDPGHSDTVTQRPHWVAQFILDFVVVMKLCISQHAQGPWGPLWVSFFVRVFMERQVEPSNIIISEWGGGGWGLDFWDGFSIAWTVHGLGTNCLGRDMGEIFYTEHLVHFSFIPCMYKYYLLQKQIKFNI